MTTTLFRELQDGLRARSPSDEALVLYGSYARGDFDCSSDFDVLRIAHNRAFKEHIDQRIFLHSYSVSDMEAMARNGSLFVLHVIQEGVLLHDPQQILQTIAASFRRPVSYLGSARESLKHAARILDVSESLFWKFPDGVYGTALFLCRTLVYADHADRGPFSFSLHDLAAQDATAALLLRLKHSDPSYSRLLQLRRAVRRYLPASARHAELASVSELVRDCGSDNIANGLLRRLQAGLFAGPYVMPPNVVAFSRWRSASERSERRGDRR